MALLGINLFRKTAIGDNSERIKEAVKEALKRSDILILTGGLGPTQDDLTKEAVSELLGKELLLDEKITAISLNPGTVLKTIIALNKKHV